jgi:hypothetical protein
MFRSSIKLISLEYHKHLKIELDSAYYGSVGPHKTDGGPTANIRLAHQKLPSEGRNTQYFLTIWHA